MRTILDTLKKSAEAEGTAPFDPSGGTHVGDDQQSQDRPQSWTGDVRSVDETEATSVSEALGSLGIQGSPLKTPDEGREADSIGYDEGIDSLPKDEKEALLAEIFPSMKAFDISYTLRKNTFSFERTVEELLNHAYLAEDQGLGGDAQHIKRGIEGFASNDFQSRGRRAKGKKKTLVKLERRSSSTPAPLADCTNKPSKWETAKLDVNYVVERTYLSTQTVTSIYHKSGASLKNTIFALCSSDTIENPHISSTHPTIQIHAQELGVDFPVLESKHLKGLILLTHPSITSAHELAKALVSSYPGMSLSSSDSSSLIPQYVPPDLSASEIEPASGVKAKAAHHLASSNVSLQARRAQALSSASLAYRASRSQPLMAGASSYYSQVSRDLASSISTQSSLQADALVATQSTDTSCDLHGVNIQDAVRIARERVEYWWANGAAEWARAGKVPGAEGYRVIVGVGRHSEGGKGKLGPAVGAMLKREGWRVDGDNGEGRLVVRGKARR